MFQMQLDAGGAYDELPAAVSHFQKGTRFYHKIQGLENALFFAFVQMPVFSWKFAQRDMAATQAFVF
jgi:hypothetical protein